MTAEDEDLVLVDPWEDLRNPAQDGEREARRLTEELQREVSRGHALYQVPFSLVGRSWARDDVLLRLADRWAIPQARTAAVAVNTVLRLGGRG